MRGKRRFFPPETLFPRITPAHAGKTNKTLPNFKIEQDHPRACGENLFIFLAALGNGGSPPRMRGKLPIAFAAPPSPRITPAHAGKTACTVPASTNFSDHPRACGENANSTLGKRTSRGSPPRMRGKRLAGFFDDADKRITPAHAGKTCMYDAVNYAECGSPPRMRGKRGLYRHLQSCWRITPAHAGKTPSQSRTDSLMPDHPRACGENSAETC